MKSCNFLKKAITLLLVATLFLCAVPAGFAYNEDDEEPLTVEAVMKKFEKGVQKPRTASLLDEPITMYVESKYGNCVYALKAPRSNSGKLATVDEGTEVTVYAIENGFCLALVSNSRSGGWIKKSVLEEESRLLEGKPGPHDTESLPKGVYRPQKGEYLDEYETMYVASKKGVRIYVFDKPKSNADDRTVIDYAYEAEEVTVIASKNGFSFIIGEDGERGWVSTSLLVYEY